MKKEVILADEGRRRTGQSKIVTDSIEYTAGGVVVKEYKFDDSGIPKTYVLKPEEIKHISDYLGDYGG